MNYYKSNIDLTNFYVKLFHAIDHLLHTIILTIKFYYIISFLEYNDERRDSYMYIQKTIYTKINKINEFDFYY